MSAPASYSLAGKRVFVAGHNGMVGSALVRRLAQENVELIVADRDELDLRDQSKVRHWMSTRKPDAVFLAAATAGGILANDRYPVDFLYNNLMIEANVIQSCCEFGAEKLLFLGSSCIYPKMASQPLTEDSLLTGQLEPTNEWYAIAKIAGIKLCQAYRRQYGRDFISAMPTNLYGPNDRFDRERSHVIPALMIKLHEAKDTGAGEVTIWGSGKPRREFLHVDDCADALVYLMKYYSGADHINVGCGDDITIDELAHLMAKVVGFSGKLVHDTSKPDGTPRKLLSVDKINALGWVHRISLESGLRDTYRWYREHAA
jgi:GDP-L-fucose synthase